MQNLRRVILLRAALRTFLIRIFLERESIHPSKSSFPSSFFAIHPPSSLPLGFASAITNIIPYSITQMDPTPARSRGSIGNGRIQTVYFTYGSNMHLRQMAERCSGQSCPFTFGRWGDCDIGRKSRVPPKVQLSKILFSNYADDKRGGSIL